MSDGLLKSTLQLGEGCGLLVWLALAFMTGAGLMAVIWVATCRWAADPCGVVPSKVQASTHPPLSARP